MHFAKRRSVILFPAHEAGQVEPNFIDDVLNNRFTFNQECYDLGVNLDWKKNPSSDIEWLILLHKGYYLVGLGLQLIKTGNLRFLDKWVELIESWIDQTEPGFIASDVTGRRVQNWIYAFYYCVTQNEHQQVSPDFLMRFLVSLSEQVEFLTNNLTPSRNHRTLELYAVFLAAVWFPELRCSDDWLRFALKALADNAARDFLPDGVHCELSTFYHHIALKNLLSVKRLAGANHILLERQFDDALRRALNFSLYVHKPDSQIPSLSDGDIDSYYDLLEIGAELYNDTRYTYVASQGAFGKPPKQRSRCFTAGGYSILRSPWLNHAEAFQDSRYLIFDCGPLGEGNHGHFDLLNIEAAAYGRSLIVDPGRYTYDESGPVNWRAMFRSTRYHNTVTVDGMNQVEYCFNPARGKFKIRGRRPEAELRHFISRNHFDYLQGVARSPVYTAIHERSILFVLGEYWLVSDNLHDKKMHEYCLRYHLSRQLDGPPRVVRDEHSVRIESSNLMMLLPYKGENGIKVEIESGFISSTYGEKHPAPMINIECWGNSAEFNTILFPFKEKAPDLKLKYLWPENNHELSLSSKVSAFSLEINSGDRRVTDYFFVSRDGLPRKWRFGAHRFSGTFCFLRLDADGAPVRHFAGPNSVVELGE